MGTRSTTHFKSEHSNKIVCSIYEQFDGYIEGTGHDLANFLKNKKIINGISGSHNLDSNTANGISCLAAQWIKHRKDRVGGVYMTHSEARESFNYFVSFDGTDIIIEVDKFKGTPEELLAYEEPVED